MKRSHRLRRALGALLLAAAASAGAAPPARVVLPGGVLAIEYRLDIEPQVDGDTFAGVVEIDLQVEQPTRRIVLNSAELVIDSATLHDSPVPPTIALDAGRETATFTFARLLAVGRHTLRLAYRGKIAANAAGLFGVRYDTPSGPARALFTQFEPGDARRFVPCRDEPAAKAIFRLEATVPEALMALSNMPVASSDAVAGGRKHVRFAPTPRMSSYLLFFGLGDFERAQRRVGDVDVGVVVKRGNLQQATYALDEAARLLAYYDDWFGTPYPLPKLDLVAAPGGSLQFGAMENWGAIMFFERFMLIDPLLSTESDRQRTFRIIAHEMAHQWFGNLVTMSWWDDIWLNEGYATWMSMKATDHFHPEWKAWLQSLENKEAVMDIDARRGTHAVVTPIADVRQAETAFDAITYGKGAQVVRTLEAFVGEDAFRDGVRRYLASHAYANTVSDDLWRALDATGTRGVIAIAHDLTRQAGVPMVSLLGSRCTEGRTQVSLAQGRFALDDALAGATRWRVPVTVAVAGHGSARTVVRGATAQAVQVAGCGPVLVNAGQAAYFRSRYAPADLRALFDHYAELGPEDQLGVFTDTASLALAGRQAMASLLDLALRVPPDADPILVGALAHQLEDIGRLYQGQPGEARWNAFARRVLEPPLAALGARKRDGESSNATIARAALLEALAEVDDDTVLADARALFDAWIADPAAPLDPDLRTFMLDTTGAHADGATWDTVHGLAQAASGTVEKRQLYLVLAQARDAALAGRALTLALAGEPPPAVATAIFSQVGERHPALAFDTAQANWSTLQPWMENAGRSAFMADVTWLSCDAALADRVEDWTARHVPAGARQTAQKSEAAIRYRAVLKRDRLPDIDRWLAAH